MLQAFSDSGGVGRRQAQSADESRTCLPADMVRTRSCRGVSPLGPAMSLGITCPLPSPPLLEGCWGPLPSRQHTPVLGRGSQLHNPQGGPRAGWEREAAGEKGCGTLLDAPRSALGQESHWGAWGSFPGTSS